MRFLGCQCLGLTSVVRTRDLGRPDVHPYCSKGHPAGRESNPSSLFFMSVLHVFTACCCKYSKTIIKLAFLRK
jgi:hypothetical protein